MNKMNIIIGNCLFKIDVHFPYQERLLVLLPKTND
jgi:hypothetical protein